MKVLTAALKSFYILMPVAIVMAFLWAPAAEILGDASRIIYFHVPIAWVSILSFVVAGLLSILFLADRGRRFSGLDEKAHNSATIGLACTVMTVITGSIWARISWGVFWNWDPRETSIVIILLIYIAYFSIQGALGSNENRGRIGSAYLILAMITLPFFAFLVPRIYPSLHPDPIINADRTIFLDGRMRATLAVAIGSFTLLFCHILSIMNRITRIQHQIEETSHEAD
ncbi:MAG: cytochrome c biogenesis protein CcsA [Spirochaetes bacterium]|nr:cytochrome c biogenesis protein CcsA [Spirochaetota bacterium]